LTQFSDLGLAVPVARAVAAKGYATPTPIQIQAIPEVLAGRDLLGIAATGTGKTAAFALPVLHRLLGESRSARPNSCRALVLCPTRELASQIAASCTSYSAGMGLITLAVYGGVSFDQQVKQLRRGVDIVVATPGRLIDHLERRTLTLDQVSILVLDEADHMLDMGFIPAVRRIVMALPQERQTLLFSATMPAAIRTLSGEMLKDPKTISVTPSAAPPARIDQRVILAEPGMKRKRCLALLCEHASERSLVFTRTKRGADRLVKELTASGIGAAAIHGNKSQSQRERVLDAFRTGRMLVLVATDIAARGIDIGGVNLVVNFDLPDVPETYVHRIGRTARAGASGLAVSFCTSDERPLLIAIERLMGNAISRGDGSARAEKRFDGADTRQHDAARQSSMTHAKKSANMTAGEGRSIKEIPFMRAPRRGKPAGEIFSRQGSSNQSHASEQLRTA
jgi:ATP-dependent RNA helicase RhlE